MTRSEPAVISTMLPSTDAPRERGFDPGLISVIMPCFNSERYLRDAIDSVLGQTYSRVELIVVDDGSTDGSSAILQRYAPRIKWLQQTNQGPMHARNRGITEAKGEFIAFLDSDDFWREDCLEQLHAVLAASDAAIAYCGWQNLGPGEYKGPLYVPPDYEAEGKAARFLAGCPWPIHAALSRRTAIIDAGGFPVRYAACEDYGLWLRAGMAGRIVRVPEVLAYYRHHGGNQVSSKRWLAAHSMLRIKEDYIADHPESVARLGPETLAESLKRALIKEGFQCYWKRDMASARKIFQYAFFRGGWRPAELKYILPAFLPARLHNALLRRRAGEN